MYIDLIVDNIPDGFKETYGFNPVDEPLLRVLFENEEEREVVNFLGKVLWLPSSNVLLATKIKSYPSRDKEHKRIKDMCDILSLLLFTDNWTKSRILDLVGIELLQKFKDILNEDDILNASSAIGVDIELTRSVLRKMIL